MFEYPASLTNTSVDECIEAPSPFHLLSFELQPDISMALNSEDNRIIRALIPFVSSVEESARPSTMGEECVYYFCISILYGWVV